MYAIRLIVSVAFWASLSSNAVGFDCALNQSIYLHTCIEDTQCNFKQQNYDIVFLVDSCYGSIDTAAFNASKTFIKIFLNNFSTNGEGRTTRIAIASVYACSTAVDLPISYEDASQKTINLILNSMSIIGGTAQEISISSALAEAQTQLLESAKISQNQNSDATVHRIVFFFTNTEQPLTKSVLEAAGRLKTLLNATLVTVAVSDSSNQPPSNLSRLASDGAALQVCDLSELQNNDSLLMEYIKNLTCKVAIGECRDPPPNKPHVCACTQSKIWLDIVIALNVVDTTNKLNVQLSLDSIFKSMTINQKPNGTRIGLIAYSNVANITAPLNDLGSTQEFLNRLSQTIQLSNVQGSNDLNLAFRTANDIASGAGQRKNTRTVIMVVTDQPFNGHLTESGNICNNDRNTIIYWQVQHSIPSNVIFGKCENSSIAVNSTTYTPQAIINTLCQANCFCPEGYLRFTENGSAECIHIVGTNNWENALQICRNISDGATLVDILSQEKQTFVDGAMIKNDDNHMLRPYYIGLKYNNNETTDAHWFWHSYNDKLIQSRQHDFNIDKNGYPDHSNSHFCVYSDNGTWKTDICTVTGFHNQKKYICQSRACDTDRYCASDMG